MREMLQSTPGADQDHQQSLWASQRGASARPQSGWEQQGTAPWDRGSWGHKAAWGSHRQNEKHEQSCVLISWWKRLRQEGGITAHASSQDPVVGDSCPLGCANFCTYHHQKGSACDWPSSTVCPLLPPVLTIRARQKPRLKAGHAVDVQRRAQLCDGEHRSVCWAPPQA